jgi:GNAT superfamily N-acetyltransferase
MPADPDDIVIERFENLLATAPALYSAGLRLREIHLFVEEEVSARDHETTDSLCVHFVAHCEGAVVGTVQYEPESNRLRQMVVAPEFRARGLGAGLVRRVAEEARTRGHSELLVHAWSRARGFYKRAGFQPIGEGYTSLGVRCHRLCLSLEGLADV